MGVCLLRLAVSAKWEWSRGRSTSSYFCVREPHVLLLAVRKRRRKKVRIHCLPQASYHRWGCSLQCVLWRKWRAFAISSVNLHISEPQSVWSAATAWWADISRPAIHGDRDAGLVLSRMTYCRRSKGEHRWPTFSPLIMKLRCKWPFALPGPGKSLDYKTRDSPGTKQERSFSCALTVTSWQVL